MAQKKPFSKEELAQQHFRHDNLSRYVLDIFEAFKTSRDPFEEKWLECQLNYLGQYQAKTKWRKIEGKDRRSKIFIKLTALKCNTAHSRIVDAFLSGRRTIPFDCEALDPESYGIPPEESQEQTRRFKKKLESHFKETELSEKVNDGVLELCVLGTAVLKGPIIEARDKSTVSMRNVAGIPVNQLDPSINPFQLGKETNYVPVTDHIPLWEYYVDANAKSTKDSIGEIHFQRILPGKFLQLAMAGGYDRAAVKEAKRRATSEDSNDKRYEQMGDNYTATSGIKDKRVSVLEYWGLVPVEYLREYGCQEVPKDLEDDDTVEALVVLASDGIVIKACLNPLGFRPFYVCPYKKIPHQIYGEGVAGAMRDSQKMINSSARLIIDNKALSGNGVIGLLWNKIDWKRTGTPDWYPGKTYYFKDGTNINEAMKLLQFPDVTGGLRELMELFERFADDETGIPKYSSGQEASFLNKTASGMSMLMTAANVNLKSVMQNIDDFWIEPIVEGYYQWFMEMDQDQSYKIPLKIKATGADSLIAKEILLENLLKAKQVTNGTPAALFIDEAKFWKKVFEILEVAEVMRPDDQIKQILEEASRQAGQGKDMRELVRIDSLFPNLTPKEQAQILVMLGIEPDAIRTGDGSPVQTVAAGLPGQGGGASPLPPGSGQPQDMMAA